MDETRSRENPFPGLRPFRTEEHHLFFGREEQTAALLALLGVERFLAVVGTSGSGKSSLVRAGLIPALHRGTMARAGSTWEVVILRPGGNPITSLARGLLDTDLYDSADAEALPRLRATLTRSHFGLVEAVRQSSALDPATNLLVVVDQFEEVFRFREQGTSAEETAGAFVSLLLAASEASERRIYVTITMRSDYLGDCANIPGLAEAVNRGEYLIPRLARDQRREAIEKPVGVSGARMAPRLVQHMLNDLGDDPDQLPVLQHALLRTWDAWSGDHGDGETIDLRHYEATGGMATALSRHADEVFDALPDDDHRTAAKSVFRALTVKGADNRGIRRPTRLDRLARIAGAPDEVVTRVVEAYRRPGVTFLMPGTGTALAPDTVIDLSHESLMRVWDRLRGWVDEEAQSARVYRRLAETADLWKDGRAGLFRDPDLGIALGWRDAARPTEAWAEQHGGGLALAMEFLDRSRDKARAEQLAWEEAMHREVEQATALAEAERRRAEERQRAAKRLKALAAGIAVVALLALGAMGFAVKARREAVENAQVAKDKEALATQAAGDAERAAAALKRTLVESDFHQGAERIEAGEGAAGLSYLARALRADPGFWPAAARAMTVIASGRFPLETFPRIAHEKVITNHLINDKESLVYTTDESSAGEKVERFVWDARTGERLYQIAPGARDLPHADWTTDGKHFFAHDPARGAIRVWEARSGKELVIPAKGLVGLKSGIDPRGHGLLLGKFADGALQAWRLPEGEASTPRLARQSRATGGFGFTPDGRRVYGTYADATIVLWESDGGGQAAEVSTRPWLVQEGGVFFTPDGETILWRTDANRRIGWERLGANDGAGSMLEFEYDVGFWLLPGGSKVALVQAFRDNSRPAPFQVSIYSLETRERVGHIQHPRAVEGIMTVMDGPFLRFPLAVTREGNVVMVWDLEAGAQLREIRTPSPLLNADLSPEGRKILTRTVTHDVMLWDLFTGRPLFPAPIEHAGSAGFYFSPEGEKVATFDGGKRVLELWESRTGRRLMEPSDHPTEGLEFTAGGERLLLLNESVTSMGTFEKQTEGDLQLLDITARPMLFGALLEGGGSIASALWSALGPILAHGREREADAAQVMFWDGSSRRLRKSLALPQGAYATFRSLELSGDGTRALLGCSDNRARVYDIAKAELVCELAHASPVESASLSFDGTRAGTGTRDGKVRLWDTTTGSPLTEPLDHGGQLITAMAHSPDGTVVASSSLDLKVRLAHGNTGSERCPPIPMRSLVGQIAFSPDGSHLVALTFSLSIPVIDVASASIVRTLDHPDACRTGRFSPDGRILAIGTGSTLHRPVGEVHFWEWREGRRVGRPLNAKGPVQQIDFSSDGALLVSGTVFDPDDVRSNPGPGVSSASPNKRGSVQVWDIATGRPMIDAVMGAEAVSTVAFNGAGTEVVAAWEDGAVRVIDLPPRGEERSGLLANLIEAVAGRRLTPAGSAIEEVPPEAIDRLREELAARGEESGSVDPYEMWARWFLTDPEKRPISPGSRVTFREHLARLRRSWRVEDLQDALVLAPSDALTHARLALVLLDALDARPAFHTDKDVDLRLRDHWKTTADGYGRRAVELAPEDPDVWAHRAEGLRRAGKDAEANAAAARAHALDAGNPNAEYVWAQALAREGKWSEADAAFTKAIDAIGAPGGSDGVTGPPLLGPLASLEPRAAPEGFRELRLPPPIPGTFEDFESVAVRGAPAGWSVRHERCDVPPHERDAGRITSAGSDVFEDWMVADVDRVVATGGAPPFFGDRLLASDRRERIDGVSPSPLLEGRFIYSLGGERESSFVHHLFTPDFDCTGRKAVYVVFRSAYEQARDAVAAIEYSIDEGKTWLPVLYRVNTGDLIKDGSGKIDAALTLRAPNLGSPLFFDDAGEPRGLSYGEFIGAPLSRELDAYLEGLPTSDYSIAKRVEAFRLPLADGRPRVRLRFLHAGRYGWYWGIDDFGLHEIPEGPIIARPEAIDPRRDPVALGGMGLAAIRGQDVGSSILKPTTFAALELEDGGSANMARRVIADGRLLLRRAAALEPDDPWIGLASAYASATGGDPEEAMASAMKALEREPPGRLTALPLAAVFLAKGDVLEQSGDGPGAAVAHELAHVLHSAATGRSTPKIIDRLARAGLSGKSHTLLARGSEWRFLDDGVDPGPGWKDAAYEDNFWSRGKARLGYGEDGEVTRTRFGPNPSRKPVSTYFRASFEVGDPALFAYLRLHVVRDDGVVLYLNGQELLRDNMPMGPIGPDTRAPDVVSNDAEQRFFDFEAPTVGLRQGRNVIAAEVHQQDVDSSDLAFDLEVEGVGGLGIVSRSASELDAIEERLAIPAELRGILWASRAERFRRAGALDRADEALERARRLGPADPGLAYERAHLLRARGDEKGAMASYREAVAGVIALKTLARSREIVFLPDAVKRFVEPLMRLTGPGLAGAARRMARIGSAVREVEARWLLVWSAELDPESHAARIERAEALIANGWIEEALAAADSALASTKGGEPVHRRVREEKEWISLRERCLTSLGRQAEAEEALADLLKAPPRRPNLSPRLIDLSKHYTASIYDGRGWHATENLRTLPETFRPRGGIDFDIRGMIQLQSGRFPPGTLEISGKDMNELYGKSFPEAVQGIQVGLRTKALHFLTSGSWCNGAAGIEVSRIVIHYEDGGREEFPIRLFEDVIDWSWNDYQKIDPDRIAWIGGRPIKRLMRKIWTNPHPGKVIREIDFVSGMSTGAPFLVAVTAE